MYLFPPLFSFFHIPLNVLVRTPGDTRTPQLGITALETWMILCCVLSGTGLCVGLISYPEESYRLWCDCETSITRKPWPTTGCCTLGVNSNFFVCPFLAFKQWNGSFSLFPSTNHSSRVLHCQTCVTNFILEYVMKPNL
jgi:hypothetical protein